MNSTQIKAAQTGARPASSRAYHSKMEKLVQQSSQESDKKVIRTPQPEKNFEVNKNNKILPNVTGKKSSSIFESLNSTILSKR